MKECNIHNAKDYLQVNQKSQNINLFDVIKDCTVPVGYFTRGSRYFR